MQFTNDVFIGFTRKKTLSIEQREKIRETIAAEICETGLDEDCQIKSWPLQFLTISFPIKIEAVSDGNITLEQENKSVPFCQKSSKTGLARQTRQTMVGDAHTLSTKLSQLKFITKNDYFLSSHKL